MRIEWDNALSQAATMALVTLGLLAPAHAQTAADAASDFARSLDGMGSIVSDDTYILALENDAAAGRPLALWQLGTMYENGEGVGRDPIKAYGYFAQIVRENVDTAPQSLEADIVGQSYVKLGEYFRDGAPELGVAKNTEEYHRMLNFAASYFRDAEAQYRLGMLYQHEDGLGVSPTLSARWLRFAADKGHCLGQAQLGDLLFNGMENYPPRPAEGLMWLNLAHVTCAGTADQAIADDYLDRALSVASPEDRASAMSMVASGQVAAQDQF